MSRTRTLTALALCASVLAADAAQAFPAAIASRPVATADGASLIQTIDYRRGGYGYRRRGVGLGIAAAIIGGVVISQAVRADGYGYRRHRQAGYSASQRCADTYRSFDWDSGTYMGYDGERHTCPYLR